MATESNTTHLGWRYPTAANNGTDFAQGVADFATDGDATVSGALTDILQPGVLSFSAGLVANPAVSGAGAVSGTGVGGGTAYILLTSATSVRNGIPSAAFSLTPTLPASGKYACVGIDLAATASWGGTASLVLSAKGTDQNTSALALANPPAVATGHLRLMNVIILNTAGTYSLAATADVRPYATVRTRDIRSGQISSVGGLSTSSGGLSSAHSGTGQYAISFVPNYPSIVTAVTAIPIGSGVQLLPLLNTVATSGFTISWYTPAGVLTDTAFSFIAIGS